MQKKNMWKNHKFAEKTCGKNCTAWCNLPFINCSLDCGYEMCYNAKESRRKKIATNTYKRNRKGAACNMTEAEHGDKKMTVPIEEAPRKAILDREEVLRSRKKYWIFRRAQDIILSALALLILSPVMLIVALIVWIDSPQAGPIFAQDRVGRDGKVFRFYKFRSMIPNAEQKLEELLSQNEMEGPAFKIKDDPRITRVGRFLRKTSIDELPQLWNILKGDMSIVGPRPPLPREVAEYGEYEKQRLLVTPGLTCFWQVQPHRNDLSFEDWVDLDIQYIQQSSFLTDWKIIFMTFGAVLGMNGE